MRGDFKRGVNLAAEGWLSAPGSAHEPSRMLAKRSLVKLMSSKATAQPSPVGDCASKPIAAGLDVPSMLKKRTICQTLPSTDAWYAKAWLTRETRSQTVEP